MILFFLAGFFFFHGEGIEFYQIPQKDSTNFYFVYRINAHDFPVEISNSDRIRRVVFYGEVARKGDIKAAFYIEDTVPEREDYVTLIKRLKVKRYKKYCLKTMISTSGGLEKYHKEDVQHDLYPVSSLIPSVSDTIVRFAWYFDSTGYLALYSLIRDSARVEVRSEAGRFINKKSTFINRGWNFIPLEFKNLVPSTYKFVLNTGKYRREVTIPVLLGSGWTEKQWKYMIMAVRYIFTPGEIDSLSRAPANEKKELWDMYWLRRDPTPGTSENEAYMEFLRRFRYAEEHYRSIFGGALSDMGIIYVTLGPPDEIERHDFERDQAPYIIWYYYRYNLKFKFEDSFGTGDYELVDPPRYMLDEIMEGIRE